MRTKQEMLERLTTTMLLELAREFGVSDIRHDLEKKDLVTIMAQSERLKKEDISCLICY